MPMKRAPTVATILQSGILHNAPGLTRHTSQEAIAEELRRILKCENTSEIHNTDYPSVTEYRKTYGQPQKYMVRLLAVSDLIGGFGVESAETARGGEWLDYVNVGETYAQTIVYFRGVYSFCTLGGYIENSRVAFK